MSPEISDKPEMSLVAETHWDREWYSSFQEFRFRLVKTLDKLFNILDTTTYQNFLLDGQTCPLQDYLEIRPEMRSKATDYIRLGRLSIGPCYILPDIFLISGEAHIRNLLLGHKMAREWGVPIHKVGYQPDAFGHIAQMPQIMQGFGIDNYIFHRGLGDEAESLKSEFWWDAPNGSRVLAQYMPMGYGNIADLLHDAPLDSVYAEAKNRVIKVRNRLQERTRTGRLLLMNGVDHLEPERDIPVFIERFNAEGEGIIIHRTMEEHCKLQAQDLMGMGDHVPVWRGEMHYGKEHPILTDTSSSHMYIKQMNAYLEMWMEHWADPINAIAKLFGGKDENPGYLWKAWHSMLTNYPHDSICTCSVDEVHRDMLPRFRVAEEISNLQVARALGDLARHISFYPKDMPLSVNNLIENIPVIVFNPLPYPVTKPVDIFLDFRETDVVKADDGDEDGENVYPPEIFEITDAAGKEVPYLLEEVVINQPRKMRYRGRTFSLEFMATIPAMGYTVFHLSPSDKEKQPVYPMAKELVVTDNSMENKFVKLEFASNGSFTLTEKATGKVFPNCMVFMDEADWGDEYDYVPMTGDVPKTTIETEAIVSLAQQTPYSVTFEVNLSWALPESLTPDRSRRSEMENDVSIFTEITLFADDPIVHITSVVDNTCEDHRFRVIFPTGLEVPNASLQCLVKEPFHVQDRPFKLPAATNWHQPPSGSDHTEGFTTVQQVLAGKAFQFSVFNQGMPNYEIVTNPLPDRLKGPCIIQTLFRAVGWLGHPQVKLANGKTKGGAGPTMQTVDSQMIGEYSFEYGLYVSAGTLESARVPQVFQNWVVPAGAIIPYDYTNEYNLIPFPRKLGFYYQMNAPKPLQTDQSLPATYSFFSLEGEGIEYSTLKTAEMDGGLVLRLWNSSRNLRSASIKCFKSPNKVLLARLDESVEGVDQQRLSLSETNIVVRDIKPSEIITVRLYF
jgi:alpha-mannosidase